MAKKLSASLEDYLEAIAELSATEGHAHTKEIADKLGVKMPSVTEALRQLTETGCVIYQAHQPVQLTDTGRAVANEIVLRHQVLKRFFTEILGLTPAKAADTACHLEHVVDVDTISRFVIFSDAISARSDARALQIHLTEAMSNLEKEDSEKYCTLKELTADETAVIDRFSRNLADPGQYGLQPGDVVTLNGVSLDKSVFRVSCRGNLLELPVTAAENIWCKR
ncbi:MAG: metal-dependent transcriptional regulator [Lentisphaerae bacterium]|nr:metal-dependent transcriptional regulator [Lentisphaerota bacterium]MBR2874022.1 metal-dependent transcriptional regulator [Lentisphaeria bacterium]